LGGLRRRYAVHVAHRPFFLFEGPPFPQEPPRPSPFNLYGPWRKPVSLVPLMRSAFRSARFSGLIRWILDSIPPSTTSGQRRGPIFNSLSSCRGQPGLQTSYSDLRKFRFIITAWIDPLNSDLSSFGYFCIGHEADTCPLHSPCSKTLTPLPIYPPFRDFLLAASHSISLIPLAPTGLIS